jgi:hypothetical protein
MVRFKKPLVRSFQERPHALRTIHAMPDVGNTWPVPPLLVVCPGNAHKKPPAVRDHRGHIAVPARTKRFLLTDSLLRRLRASTSEFYASTPRWWHVLVRVCMAVPRYRIVSGQSVKKPRKMRYIRDIPGQISHHLTPDDGATTLSRGVFPTVNQVRTCAQRRAHVRSGLSARAPMTCRGNAPLPGANLASPSLTSTSKKPLGAGSPSKKSVSS